MQQISHTRRGSTHAGKVFRQSTIQRERDSVWHVFLCCNLRVVLAHVCKKKNEYDSRKRPDQNTPRKFPPFQTNAFSPHSRQTKSFWHLKASPLKYLGFFPRDKVFRFSSRWKIRFVPQGEEIFHVPPPHNCEKKVQCHLVSGRTLTQLQMRLFLVPIETVEWRLNETSTWTLLFSSVPHVFHPWGRYQDDRPQSR